MQLFATTKRFIALCVSLAMFGTYSMPAWSGLVSTDQLLQESAATLERDAMLSMLDRDEVRRQLVERGVDPQDAKQRIAALSDAQVNQLRDSIDDLPAGSGVLEILIAVVLVLVILDAIGVTDIFPFIHPPASR
jgi:hypothetical protein